ncbi:vitamin K epoxide reductase family protein [Microbacterium excoecariae]|uniref:vitamin K epoxide reductase family protein n=1 Tax=Microbacterium excoecariae TaxID=2715210 RepID=UPI00140E253A|nr:vitamin K epoxide reductase family protein [Microbacterium excoecariae]NHI16973.1 vitamin K epoxide reductase family protein [Microbacterium excoecariae]
MQKSHQRPVGLAIWLVLAGIVGLGAAFALTLEKFEGLVDPDHVAGCDFNPIVQCGANLDSAQGSVFGFPNPLLGLVGWMAPLVVGMAILAGARFAKWFWVLFTLGLTFAFGFVCWLIAQSIFVIGTLCPWCMVTWSVTIPSFYAVLLHSVRIGAIPLPASVRRLADTLMGWLPLIVTVSFVAIAVIAELRLHLLAFFF